MRYIEKETKLAYELKVKADGSQERVICPVCNADRKKINAKDLSINGDVGNCKHCGRVFYREVVRIKNKVFARPVWKNKTKLSDKTVKWFESRGISQFTLDNMSITEGIEYIPQISKERNTIQFNYFVDGELVNIKYRDAEKNFKLFKDAELVLYNLDNVITESEMIITEGEIDALSYIESGLSYAVSVPNGASGGKPNLEYLDNYLDVFANKDKIYLATDNDTPGVLLRNELLRRLGYIKCRKVDFEDCKDANEYLIKYGKERLRQTIENASEFPIEGVMTANDFKEDLLALYESGMDGGVKIAHENLNNLATWETGRLLTVTGIPGMGKSEFMDELCIMLNIAHGWKTGYFSPENFPLSYHASKLAEKIIGKRFKKSQYGMSTKERDQSIEYINENFFFISPSDENYSLDNILERSEALVHRYGVRIIVLDPWNRIEHQIKNGQSETNYTGEQLTKITNFAQRNDILFILVAHPFKMGKDSAGNFEIPTLYSISGSANFFNKTDYGICVHIHNKSNDNNDQSVGVYVQKVKFKFLGKVGLATFKYDQISGRFFPCEVDDFNKPIAGSWEVNDKSYLDIDNKIQELVPDLDFGQTKNVPF